MVNDEFFDEILDAAYNADKVVAEGKRPQQRPQQVQRQPRQQIVRGDPVDDLESWLNEGDDSDIGIARTMNMPMQENPVPAYDAEREMEHIKKLHESGQMPQMLGNRRIPKAILESVTQNPLFMDPSAVTDPRRAELDQMLEAKFGQNGGNSNLGGDNPYEKVMRITESLEEDDKKKELAKNPSANAPSQGGGANVDYSLIKTIVSAVLDEKLEKKFAELRQNVLNESRTPQINLSGLKFISLKEKDTILLLDKSDNVFECSIKYKGPNKRK